MYDQKWILDSDCSRHVIEEAKLLKCIKEKSKGTISPSDKGKCKIKGIGDVQTTSTSNWCLPCWFTQVQSP